MPPHPRRESHRALASLNLDKTLTHPVCISYSRPTDVQILYRYWGQGARHANVPADGRVAPVSDLWLQPAA